jgi:Uma2 family endonuclease
MGAPEEEPARRYTSADRRTWGNDERWEIIGGQAYCMSPGPTARHQRILRDLTAALTVLFRKGSGEVFPAPLDVRLSDTDVVQPDLVVVCDPRQVAATHIEGAPTLAVEILSPTSAAHDRVRKTALYTAAGVQEYWIVTPHPSVVEVLALDGPGYRLHRAFGKDDTLTSPAFPDLHLKLCSIFTFPIEPGDEVPVVREPPATPYAAG